MRLASCAHYLGVCHIALFVVSHNLDFAWLIHHIVPAETVAVETVLATRSIRVSKERSATPRHWLLNAVGEIVVHANVDMLQTTLALAIDEEFSFWIAGIAEYWCDLTLAALPCPVREHVESLVGCVPVGAVEINAVFWQTCKVEDAEI